MRKIVFFSTFLFSLTFLTSCKKNSDKPNDTDYYIEAKVDGVQKKYTANTLAGILNYNGIYSLSMAAYASTSSVESFTLSIGRTDGPVTEGTYDYGASSNYQVISGFVPVNDADIAYGAGLEDGPDPALQIVITELTDSRVSGTFNGSYFDEGGIGSNKMVVTDGKFNLPIQK